MQQTIEYNGVKECPKCYGTGEDQDSVWTLETARRDARAYNKHRLIREYGPDTKVMCGCPDVVSPLHFKESGKEKCYHCQGTGQTPEYRKYLYEMQRQKEAFEKAQAQTEHRANYSHLILVTNDRNAATKNIKKELAQAFPGVKFSVRRRHYTAIDIDWDNGPTTKEVEAITSKYQEGSFDGMTDCYEYSKDDSFTDLYGGARYVFENRHYADSDYITVVKAICKAENIEYNDQYWDIEIPKLRERACTLANRLLGSYSIPIGYKVSGIEWTGQNAGRYEELFRPVFEKI